jgi:hypothetical protein
MRKVGGERVAAWLEKRRRRVIAFVTAFACVFTAALVVTAHRAGDACDVPTELTVLTSVEANDAVQQVLREFERYAADRADSSCPVVHVTAYAAVNGRRPGSAPGERTLEAQFAGWIPDGLAGLGARPSVWISDSPYDVGLARRAIAEAGGSVQVPDLEELGVVADSPLVLALPSVLEDGPLRDLVQEGMGVHEGTWKSVYGRLQAAGIGLVLPDPASSDTGLFQLAGLGQGLGTEEGLRAATAHRDYRPDSLSLLCPALQDAVRKKAALPANTAYLVTEAAVVNYNMGRCGAGTLRPTRDQELQPFYLPQTRPLRFTFTSVRWGTSQDGVRSRYARAFYSWLADREKGGRLLADAGMLRVPSRQGFCDTSRAMQAYRAAGQDRACRGVADGAVADEQARQVLTALEKARPPAQVVIAIDTSKTMAPNLTPIRDAVASALVPADAAGPVGGDDRLALWRFPGSGGATRSVLMSFMPGTWEKREEITSRLAGLAPAAHSAVYDTLLAAGAELGGLPSSGSPVQAVVLLTDGDGYGGKDPGGGTLARVTAEKKVNVYVIAFGSIGCRGPLRDLAERNRGSCRTANVPELDRQLTQVLGEVAKGK